MNAPAADLDSARIDPSLAGRIPAALALRRLALPLCALDGRCVLAMADVSDEQTVRAVGQALGMPVDPVPADSARLREALRRVYGDVRAGAAAPAGDPVAAVESIFRAAALRGASDIHFDPEADSMRVRIRVDGELEEIERIPAALKSAVCSRIKVLASLDIAERRAPQDGGFTWTDPARPESPIDVRAATLPVRHGERITLRLLETGASRFTLDRLGLREEDRAIFDRVLAEPHGLVLLTGPTGSGKTTTLHAAMRELLRGRPLNILTVEDPIEYEIPGVSQAEVDGADKVNFAKALRSLLRHDPDVVMIGEIRDAESLDVAVKAALTGHLVLSSLHANNSVSAVTRLVDMGLAPHLAGATLRLSVAQRLVRALCPGCRVRRPASAAEAAALSLPADAATFAPRGCIRCAGRGYAGRIGVFECFEPDAETASRIASGAREDELRALARERGMRTLSDDARAKALSGATSVSELLRIV